MLSFKRPRIAVAIVTMNKRSAVLQLLDYLKTRNIPVYVTDNASTDGTAEAVRETHPWVCLLASKHNLGGTGGFNCAVLAALTSGAHYIVLIDDDALPVDDCLEQMADFLDQKGDYAYVAPAVYISSKPGILQETGGDLQPFREPAVEAWNRFRPGAEVAERALDIGYASACCLMIRAESILRVGVMEWGYFLFSDDVDWCVRLNRSAGRGACLPGAKVQHDFPWAKPFASMRLYFFHRNNLLLFSRIMLHDQRYRTALRGALTRTFRSWIRAWAAGDQEVKSTLAAAFSDAFHGRYGAWRNKPAPVAITQKPLNKAFFERKSVCRVLLVIHMEEFLEPMVKRLRELAGSCELSIDLLCDAHRVEHWRATGLFEKVTGRAPWYIRRMLEPIRLRQGRYDLSVEDMFMDPRDPTGMAGREAALFHAGEIYFMPNRFWASYLALPAAPAMAWLAGYAMSIFFPKAPAATPPPQEARALLDKINIESIRGQPGFRYGNQSLIAAAHKLAQDPAAADALIGRVEQAGGYHELCALEVLAPSPCKTRKSRNPGDETTLFSIITPLRNTRPSWLRDLIESVRKQTYSKWEFFLVDDGSEEKETLDEISNNRHQDRRIKFLKLEKQSGISMATNYGAVHARGEYLVFLDHDDKVAPCLLEALAEHIKLNGKPAILYADEDRFNDAFDRCWPGVKGDFSRWNLWNTNYLHHPVAVRKDMFDQVGGLRSDFDGSQDLDLILRLIEREASVCHIPEILYHMRIHEGSLASSAQSKAYAHERGLKAVNEAFQRTSFPANAEFIADMPGHFALVPTGKNAIEIAVVAVDYAGTQRPNQLDACWPGARILRIEHGPRLGLKILDAMRSTPGDVLIVTDQSCHPRFEGGFERLARYALLPGVGMVTPQVRDNEGRLIHAGLSIGGVVPVRAWHRGCCADHAGYGGWMRSIHEVDAPSPWCFAISKFNVERLFEGMGTPFSGEALCSVLDWSMTLTRNVNCVHLFLGTMQAVMTRDHGVADDLKHFPKQDFTRWAIKWREVVLSTPRLWSKHLSSVAEDIRFKGTRDVLLEALGAGYYWDEASAGVLYDAAYGGTLDSRG